MANLQDIYSELQNDSQFHENFKKNPEQALKQKNFELSPSDLAKIKAMLKLDQSKDEELDDRISK